MARKNEIQEWLGTGFKAVLGALLVIATYVFNNSSSNLTKSIELLTAQLRAMEMHQIDTDKRVAAIEVSREINLSSFQKIQTDVQDTKTNVLQLTMRLQTISDFISRHFK